MDDPEQPQPDAPEPAAVEPAAAEPAAEERRPSARPFRKRFTENRLSPESAERQGSVARLAWEQLGGADEAKLFLNTFDDALGGRPLDLAVESAAGFEAVKKAIAERAARA